MPLELGIDIGCKLYGDGQAQKSILILDSERFRYQKYVSDLAGYDIESHAGKPLDAVICVRHWLSTTAGTPLRAGSAIRDRYVQYQRDLPAICEELHFDHKDLNFADLSFTIAAWLREHS